MASSGVEGSTHCVTLRWPSGGTGSTGATDSCARVQAKRGEWQLAPGGRRSSLDTHRRTEPRALAFPTGQQNVPCRRFGNPKRPAEGIRLNASGSQRPVA